MRCVFGANGRCEVCGRPKPKTDRRVIANCSGEPTEHKQAAMWLACPHRGPIVATITGRVAGCGCSGSTVEVYQCSHFHEPVLKQAAARCLETIQAKAPSYTGRTCRECNVPMQAGEPETIPDMPPPPQTIGVVVTSHNYGRYLRQCLDSIIAQTVRPQTIVLVDDASDDDTGIIGQEYTRIGVKHVRVDFRDVAKARNHGAGLCGNAGYLCFVDADDYLPPDYLRLLRGGMTDPRVAVTYPQCDRFNETKELGLSPWIVPFDPVRLRRQNFACATSLIRRQALEQVGGWQSYKYGLHDWDLWLRIVRAGWTMQYVKDTALRYRLHNGSMSDERHGNFDCGAEVMSRSQLTAVVTLFSGRVWMLDRWFESLAAIEWPRESLHLVAVDNSRDPAFASRLREKLDGWRHTYVRDDRRIVESVPTEEAARGATFRRANTYAIGVHLARLYSLATQYLPAGADNVWSVEDDVTMKPESLRTLARELFRTQAASTSGCLRSRFGNRTIAWRGKTSVSIPPDGVEKIDKTGFFCHLVRREAWDKIAWRPGDTGTDRIPYYDWSACTDIQATGPIYLVGSVRCRHWQADGTAIDC